MANNSGELVKTKSRTALSHVGGVERFFKPSEYKKMPCINSKNKNRA